MDPNANLEEQLRLAAAILNRDDMASALMEKPCREIADSIRVDSEIGELSDENAADASRLAELVLALDEWLRKGGFLPTVWKEGPNGVCESTCHGWCCTLPAGHKGSHRACTDNANKNAAHVWANRG